MKRPVKRLLTCLFLLTCSLPAVGQTTDLTTLFAGKSTPLSVRLGDLNGEWRGMNTGASGGAGGLGSMLSPLIALGMMSGLGGAGGGGADSSAMMGLAAMGSLFGGGSGLGSEPTYYTQGKTLTVGGETLLIAYRYAPKPFDFSALMQSGDKNGGKDPDFEALLAQNKVTADTSLALCLLNLRTTSAFSHIHAFDLNTELGVMNQSNALMDMLRANKSKPDAAKPMPVTPNNTKADARPSATQAR